MGNKKSKKKNRNKILEDEVRDIKILEYEITSEPIKDRQFKRLPSNVRDRIEDLHYKIVRKPKEAIPELEKLIKKYPRVPQFYNFLSVAYSNTGDYEKARSLILESCEKHPNYLFSKLNYAEYCIKEGNIEKIPEIFDNKLELKLLYPKRKRFHISEVVNFAGTIGYYYAKAGNRRAAEAYYKFLRQLAPRHRIAKRLKRELHPSVFRRMLRKLLKPLSDWLLEEEERCNGRSERYD